MSDALYDPAAGGVGYLTFDQFDRFRRATEDARKYVPWLRVAGYLKTGVDPDEGRGAHVKAASLPLGLPATWLAAEEITQLLQEINKWSTLEDVAKFGSEFALQLTREVETAAHKWPLEDRSRPVKFFRCTACGNVTLRYYPPSLHGGETVDSVVKCTDPACRTVISELMFSRMALLIEIEQREKLERVRQLGKSGRRSGKSEQVEADGVFVDTGWSSEDVASGEGFVAISS